MQFIRRFSYLALFLCLFTGMFVLPVVDAYAQTAQADNNSRQHNEKSGSNAKARSNGKALNKTTVKKKNKAKASAVSSKKKAANKSAVKTANDKQKYAKKPVSRAASGAVSGKSRTSRRAGVGAVKQANGGRYAAIVIDAQSGYILHAEHADELRYPASLTKMMTLYMAFKALEQQRLSLDSRLLVSARAAAQSPTKLGLKKGQSVRLQDAMLGLITESANDAAVVIAEALGGSEEAFASQMTSQARALGMAKTVFRNASGLPDTGQLTTARDMARLGWALMAHYPQYYKLFGTTSFVYAGRAHANHNHLMKRYVGMDGIKTGYVRASGFNLVASAARGNKRIIGVVFGGTSSKQRDNRMAYLLDDGFIKVNDTPSGGEYLNLPLRNRSAELDRVAMRQ